MELSKLVICRLGFAMAMIAAATTSVWAEKIAVVDVDRVTAKAMESAPKDSGLRGADLEKIQGDIQQRLDKIRELDADLRRSDGVMAPDALDKKRKEMTRLKNEVDELEKRGRKEMQRLNDLVYDPILKRVRYAIEDVATEKKLDLVVARDRVLWIGPNIEDITDAVLLKTGLDADTTGTASGTTETLSSGSERSDAPRATSRPASSKPSSSGAAKKPTSDKPRSSN